MDQTFADPLLNSASHYQRINPVVGATYKFSPALTAYAGYSEANRAPTPLELGCSSPTNPCIIDNFLIADPPLKQVVSHTYETGIRGSVGTNAQTGRGRLVGRHVLHPAARRHHQRRRLAADDRLLPECRQHPARGHRGQDQLPVGSLDHLRQLHLRRCDVPAGAAHLLAQRSLRRRQRQHPSRSRRPHPRHSRPALQGGLRICRRRRLEVRRRRQLHRHPVADPRRQQPQSRRCRPSPPSICTAPIR